MGICHSEGGTEGRSSNSRIWRGHEEVRALILSEVEHDRFSLDLGSS